MNSPAQYSFIVIAVAIVGYCSPCSAQTIPIPKADEGRKEAVAKDTSSPPLDPNRYEPAALPVISGNSDVGFMFGAIGVLAKFEHGRNPYKWRTQLLLAMSVKKDNGEVRFPTHEYTLTVDIPGLLNNKLRLSIDTGFMRTSNQGYYGLGNASEIAPFWVPIEDSNGQYNEYIYNRSFLKLSGRIPIFQWLDMTIGISGKHTNVQMYKLSELSMDAINTDSNGQPVVWGLYSHFTMMFFAGLLLDTRDHETAPTKGMFHELSFRNTPGFFTNFSSTGACLDTRFFFPLAHDYLVLGIRMAGDLLGGQPPVYELGEIGTFTTAGMWGTRGVRGVPAERYLGKIRVLGSAELRSMFAKFKVKTQRFRLGMVAFFDTGRVFTDYTPNPELDGNGVGLKWGTGGGLRVQWGETVIIRADFAYSPEMAKANPGFPVGIYVDIDQAF